MEMFVWPNLLSATSCSAARMISRVVGRDAITDAQRVRTGWRMLGIEARVPPLGQGTLSGHLLGIRMRLRRVKVWNKARSALEDNEIRGRPRVTSFARSKQGWVGRIERVICRTSTA